MSAKKTGRKKKNTLRQMKRNAQALANIGLAAQTAVNAMQTAIVARQGSKCSQCIHAYEECSGGFILKPTGASDENVSLRSDIEEALGRR